MNAHDGEVGEVRMSFGWPFWVYMVPGTLLVLTMAVISLIDGLVLYSVLLLAILFFSFRLHRRFVVHMDRQGFRTFFVLQGRRDHPLERLTQVVVPKAKAGPGPYALEFHFATEDGRVMHAWFEVGAKRHLERVLRILCEMRPDLVPA